MGGLDGTVSHPISESLYHGIGQTTQGFDLNVPAQQNQYTKALNLLSNADEYDFIISKDDKKYFVDVKTRTKKFHTRTLEMVKQFHSKKIDIYISVFLMRDNSNFQIKILGWCNKKDIIKINRIENNGYLDNYVLYDKELRDINQLINYL